MPRWVITVSTVVAISSSCWDGAPATDPRPDASSSDPEDTGSETDTDSGDALPACSSLRAVWGIAPGEVWAAGDCGMAARFDGSQWQVVFDPECEYPFSDVWAFSAGRVLAVDRYGAMTLFDVEQGEISHEHDFDWEPRTAWARAEEDLFVAGVDGFAARHDGAAWTVYELGEAVRIRDLLGFGSTTGQDGWANNVWAVGGDHSGPDPRAVAFHFDGHQWSLALTIDRPGP